MNAIISLLGALPILIGMLVLSSPQATMPPMDRPEYQTLDLRAAAAAEALRDLDRLEATLDGDGNGLTLAAGTYRIEGHLIEAIIPVPQHQPHLALGDDLSPATVTERLTSSDLDLDPEGMADGDGRSSFRLPFGPAPPTDRNVSSAPFLVLAADGVWGMSVLVW